MVKESSFSRKRDERLDDVLAAYVDAVEAGEKIDRDEWLRRYPDLAADLTEFFTNRDRLEPPADPVATVDWTGKDPAEDLPIGAAKSFQFGPYQILAEIARGGMGVVYRAHQVGLKRVVALKMIVAGALADADAVRRFRTEAEAAASLDHPNIVPVYEVGDFDGNHFFTMKLIEGENLARWIARERVPCAKVSARMQRDMARLLATVARAVHHAHQRGVLHRDLKPGNILLQRDRTQSARGDLASATPLVTDFGLAKRAGADGGISQSLQIVGTASYMAPEQARTTAAPLTVAADVYSLGAVLYEMLTGQPPFRGGSFLDTLVQVIHQPLVPPRQLHSRIDADLERICVKCLAKAPEDRYAGADALAADLENWAAGETVSVRPPGRLERTWRWCRRNPPVAVLLFVVASLVGAGIVFSTIMNVQLTLLARDLETARDTAQENARHAEENSHREADAHALADRALEKTQAALQREEAALREEKIQRAKSRELLVRQYVSNGVALMDGSDPLGALAWFGEALNQEQGDPAREWPHRIRLAAALRRCPRLLHAAFHDGGAAAFCLSGDGKLLFTAERKGPARLWDIQTDKVVSWRLADDSAVSHAVFSPDSRLLATGHTDGQVTLWKAPGGDAAGKTLRHTGGITSLEFNRDGKRLLTASRDGTARIWDIPSGKPLSTPLKHGAEVSFAAFSADGRLVVTTGISVADKGGDARVWEWDLAKLVGKPLHHKLGVTGAVFSPDSRRLFTSADNHNLRIWDLTTSKSLPLPPANQPSKNGPWFSRDGQRMLFAQGNMAQVYDLNTLQPLGKPLTHGADLLLAGFSNDGRQCVTAGWDRVVRVWDPLTGQPLSPPLRHPRRALGLAFDNAGQRLVTSCDDGAVRVWDLRGREQAPPVSLTFAGSVLALAPGGGTVLASGKGGTKIWDVAAKTPVSKFLPGAKFTQAAFSSDGKRFVTLDPEGLRLWDLAVKPLAGRLLGPGAKVEQIAFSPSGQCVVALLGGDQLRCWDAATGAEVAAGKQIGNPTWDAPVVSPDGRRVATYRFKKTLQIWNVVGGNTALIQFPQTANVVHAAFSPDGQRLAIATADGTVRVWNAKTAEPLTPPLVHGQFLHLTGFSLDGRALVTAGSDGAARVWDASTAQPLTALLHQAEPIAGASFSPDGNRLATISKGGIVHLWDLRADARRVEDLLELSKLLSGQQMHAVSGSFIPFVGGALRQPWSKLRADFPAEFGAEERPKQ